MRRSDWGILVPGLVGLALFATGMLGGGRGLVAPGCVIAGLAGAASLLRVQRRGVLRTLRGLVRRSDHPALFRFHAGCGWIALLLWTLSGLLFGLGVLGPR
jgi:hypothetical protein